MAKLTTVLITALSIFNRVSLGAVLATPAINQDVAAREPVEDQVPSGNLSRILDDNTSTSNALVARAEQKNPGWALNHLSADQQPPRGGGYQYLDDNGKGVDIYVFDTGIDISATKDEFDDRVIDELNYSDEPDDTDKRNHGTKVASAIGGNLHGVAKSATLRNVKFYIKGSPNAATFASSMAEIIKRHNERKKQEGFKGSIVNMSFTMLETPNTEKALADAYDAGISLVAAAGNRGLDPNAYPAINQYVISVGAIDKEYQPWESSNYGVDNVNIWAPGKDVSLLDKTGTEVEVSGTSYACGYVSGILAIYYGVEGKDMTPKIAREKLFVNADVDYIKFPDGKDWKNSPNILANTGYLKGQQKSPKVPYLDGPPLADSATGTSTTNPSVTPTHHCQSPDHHTPLTPFTLDQGEAAIGSFSQCQVELQPGKTEGCILHFNPCAHTPDTVAVDVILRVQQLTWINADAGIWPDGQEMVDAMVDIMYKCDTTTKTKKWGGFKSVETANGIRMYNVTANQIARKGNYPSLDHFHTVSITSGAGDCAAWEPDPQSTAAQDVVTASDVPLGSPS